VARAEWRKKIGTLSAYKKRQRYDMLCEADLDSGDLHRAGGPGAGERKLFAKRAEALSKDLRERWPFGQPSTVDLPAWKSSGSKKQSRRQNGYEDMNLFAWTSV